MVELGKDKGIIDLDNNSWSIIQEPTPENVSPQEKVWNNAVSMFDRFDDQLTQQLKCTRPLRDQYQSALTYKQQHPELKDLADAPVWDKPVQKKMDFHTNRSSLFYNQWKAESWQDPCFDYGFDFDKNLFSRYFIASYGFNYGSERRELRLKYRNYGNYEELATPENPKYGEILIKEKPTDTPFGDKWKISRNSRYVILPTEQLQVGLIRESEGNINDDLRYNSTNTTYYTSYKVKATYGLPNTEDRAVMQALELEYQDPDTREKKYWTGSFDPQTQEIRWRREGVKQWQLKKKREMPPVRYKKSTGHLELLVDNTPVEELVTEQNLNELFLLKFPENNPAATALAAPSDHETLPQLNPTE